MQTGTPTQPQLEAIAAALRRLFPDMTEQNFAEEMAWAIREIRYEHDGSINWRSMNIGQLLLDSISEAQCRCCCYCGIETEETGIRRRTFEHVIKKGEGGLDHPDNLSMACYMCNNARANQTIAATE